MVLCIIPIFHQCAFSIFCLLECLRLKVHLQLSNDIFEGDIRDGWITENLLKRANPSCTLIRHTLILKWYYLYHIGRHPDRIQSVSSAALLFIAALFYNPTFSSRCSSSSYFAAHDFAQTACHSGCLGNLNRISNGLSISTILCLGID